MLIMKVNIGLLDHLIDLKTLPHLLRREQLQEESNDLGDVPQ